MLDRQTLINRIAAGETFSYLFFGATQFQRTPRLERHASVKWYPSPFTVDGNLYPTAEHWMMASKARLFGDDEMLKQILKAPDPQSAIALGRHVANFDDRFGRQTRDDWLQKAAFVNSNRILS